MNTNHPPLLLMTVLKLPPKLMKMDQLPQSTLTLQELASLQSLMKADQSLKFTHLMLLPALIHQPPHLKPLLDQQSLKKDHTKPPLLPHQEQLKLSLMILEQPLLIILIVKVLLLALLLMLTEAPSPQLQVQTELHTQLVRVMSLKFMMLITQMEPL